MVLPMVDNLSACVCCIVLSAADFYARDVYTYESIQTENYRSNGSVRSERVFKHIYGVCLQCAWMYIYNIHRHILSVTASYVIECFLRTIQYFCSPFAIAYRQSFCAIFISSPALEQRKIIYSLTWSASIHSSSTI